MEIASNFRKVNIRIIICAITSILLVILIVWKHHVIGDLNRIVSFSLVAISLIIIATIPHFSNGEKCENYYQRVDLMSLLLVVSLILQLFLSFAFFRGTVSGNSMYPTLTNEEFVVVKATKKIEKNDIVILYVDKDINKLAYGVTNDELLIKRVIGVAGDEVHAVGGKVYVNGVEETGPLSNLHTSDFDLSSVVSCNLDIEESPLVIPEGYILVLGDNRSSSNDSRYLGLFRIDQILGRVVYKKGNTIFDLKKIQ